MARDERLEQRLGLTTLPRPVAPLSDPRPAAQAQRGRAREMIQEALALRGVTDPGAVERAIAALGLNEGRDLDRATAERYAALAVEHHAADLASGDSPLSTPDADLGRRGEQAVHLDALLSPNEWLNAAIRADRRTLDPHRFYRPE